VEEASDDQGPSSDFEPMMMMMMMMIETYALLYNNQFSFPN
jgi:hypothetical protein